MKSELIKEGTANHHSKFVRNIFNIGQIKDQERWDLANKVVDSKPPIIRVTIKDHKDIPVSETCSDTRSLTNGKDGPISRVESHN